jgi:hypothetical protein
MPEDLRCCGSGTCIIAPEGRCWCGQRWEGDQLVGATPPCAAPAALNPGNTAPDTLSAPTRHEQP